MPGLLPNSLERVQNAISTRRAPAVQSMAASLAQRRWRQARSARVREALFGEQIRNRKILDGIRQAYIAARENQVRGASEV